MSATQPQVDPLTQVLMDPDSDGPRIAFASAVASTDSNRAAFIRRQVAIASIAGNDDERQRAILLTAQLLSKHSAEWRPDWPEDLTRAVCDYGFHRGFVELIEISGADFLEMGEALLRTAPIRHLNLTGTAGLWKDLHQSPLLAKIRSISVTDNDLTDEDLYWFARTPYGEELRWLDLSNNDIGKSGVDYLAATFSFPNLDYVSLAGNLCDPVERFASDGDLITDAWLPQDGQELERKYRPIGWLHIRATHLQELPPDRFALPKNASSVDGGRLPETHPFSSAAQAFPQAFQGQVESA